jgi:hypothetical protein
MLPEMRVKALRCSIPRHASANPITTRQTRLAPRSRTVCITITRSDKLKTVRNRRETWIGLVGVMPSLGASSFDGMKGAYVNAVTPASSAAEFRSAVESALRPMGLFPFEFEELEPLEARACRVKLSEEIQRLAIEANASGQVCFDTFHRFSHLDS